MHGPDKFNPHASLPVEEEMHRERLEGAKMSSGMKKKGKKHKERDPLPVHRVFLKSGDGHPTAEEREPFKAYVAERISPNGAPPIYDRIAHPRLARAMCKLGATDMDLADCFGVTPTTITTWSVKHEEFADALKVAKGEFDERVQRSLAQRAVGYTYESEKIFLHEGQPVIVPTRVHVPPDVAAQRLWLTSRRRTAWHDPDTPEGANAVTNITVNNDIRQLEALTNEQLEKLTQLMTLVRPEAFTKPMAPMLEATVEETDEYNPSD